MAVLAMTAHANNWNPRRQSSLRTDDDNVSIRMLSNKKIIALPMTNFQERRS